MADFVSVYPYPKETVAGVDKAGVYFHSLTPAHKACLETLEKWVVDENIDMSDLSISCLDHRLTLLRYLRAFKFDTTKALEGMKSNIIWRKTVGVKEIITKTPEEILGFDLGALMASYVHYHYGYDKTGRPVLYKKYKSFEASKLKEICGGKFDQIVNYHIWEHEVCATLCLNQSNKLKQTVETMTVVIDVKDMKVSQVSRDFLALTKLIAKVDQEQYPETMGKTFIINAPTVFPMVWKMVKPFIDPVTAAKIQVLGGPKAFKPVLQEFIGVDNLPADYDGAGVSLDSLPHPYAEYMGLSGKFSGDVTCDTSLISASTMGEGESGKA